LVIAAAIVAIILYVLVKTVLGNMRRSQEVGDYEKTVTALPPADVPAHVWGPVPSDFMQTGLPGAASMPSWAKAIVSIGEPGFDIDSSQQTTINNLTFTMFDSIQWEQRQDMGPQRRVTAAHCSVNVGANFPPLSVTHKEGLGNGQVRGNAVHSVQFALGVFNDVFSGVGSDDRFATTLFDNTLMQWCLQERAFTRVALSGESIVMSFKPKKRNDPEAMLAFTWGFLQHIPPTVWSEWGMQGAPPPTPPSTG
jgi:hypothetical protein